MPENELESGVVIGTDDSSNRAQQSEPDSQDDLPIFRQPPRKRRAVSGLASASTYLSPAKIVAIFPDISVGQLCQLSDVTLVPSEVPAIVPDVSVDQMSRFFQLIEKSSPAPVTQPANEIVQSDSTDVQAPAHDTVV